MCVCVWEKEFKDDSHSVAEFPSNFHTQLHYITRYFWKYLIKMQQISINHTIITMSHHNHFKIFASVYDHRILIKQSLYLENVCIRLAVYSFLIFLRICTKAVKHCKYLLIEWNNNRYFYNCWSLFCITTMIRNWY